MSEAISVITTSQPNTHKLMPYKFKWKSRVYPITEISMHFTLFEGDTLCHIFNVNDGQSSFRLKLNTKSLQWILEEVIREQAA